MLDSVRHRLDEIEVSHTETPVFIYVQCGHPEAFVLGQNMAAIWGIRELFSDDFGSAPWRSLAMNWRIRAMSGKSDKHKPYHLDLGKVLDPDDDGGAGSLVEARPGLLSRERGRSGSTFPRLAVLVYAADDSGGDSGFLSFSRHAENAAGGNSESGYLVSADDLCDHSLILKIPVKPLISSLHDESDVNGARYVKEILTHWKRFARETYGNVDVPVRLFAMAPSILVCAVAAFLPQGSRLVPWVGNPEMKIPDDSDRDVDVIAIVDGDDVGAGMERELLSGDLNGAIEYSARMSAVMEKLVKRIGFISGVSVVSTGGDSVIFAVRESTVKIFMNALEASRLELGYRFSCGLGSDSREAFIALRTAKSSGKNKTVGP